MSDQFTTLEIQILRILEDHQGRENAIGRVALVDQINAVGNADLRSLPIHERQIRMTIKHLVERHSEWIGSCSKGYFMVQTDQELLDVCKYYRGYALSALHIEAKLRKVSLPSLLGQLSFELGDRR